MVNWSTTSLHGLMLVRDSKSRCTSDSTLTVTCYIIALTSALWASGRGLWPKTLGCSRTCQAYTSSPRPWLQRVGSCHLRSTTPVENSRGWAARTHPNEQPGAFRQCHVARRYGSAHESAGRDGALGHSWRSPFLLRQQT